MKTSGYLVLYISENDDFELWRALCQYTSEERAAVVQAALRKGLLPDSNPGTNQAAATVDPQRAFEPLPNIEPKRTAELLRTADPKRSAAQASVPVSRSPFESSGLSRPTLQPPVAIRPAAANPAPQQNPASPSPIADLMLDDLGADLIRSLTNDEVINNTELTDLNDLSSFLQPADTQQASAIPGLNFLLNNVIGEEDDESVVEYIRRSRAAIDGDQG